MTLSHFSIQGRPTPYLFFSTGDKAIRVTSTGLASEFPASELEYLRWADTSQLTDNAQFVAALSVARAHAAKLGAELQDDSVYFD